MSTSNVKEKKDHIFSPKKVLKEIKQIKWPAKKDLLSNSVQIIIFTAFFALFFYLCQFVISVLLNVIGGR